MMRLNVLTGVALAVLMFAGACNDKSGDTPAGEEAENSATEGEEAEGEEAEGEEAEGEEAEEEQQGTEEEGEAEPETPVETAQADDPTAAPADVAAPPADARTTASGLAIKTLSPGNGSDLPVATDTVSVHYTGWTTDGEMFDSSVARGQPASFPLSGVIAGWTEGLQLMSVGERARLWIPEDLAYGGRPGRPAGMLVFDVELLDILRPPEAPADVAAAPGDAEVTSTGLATKVLSPGSGSVHPTATDFVTVHYSGWTTDGSMFDSSRTRGQPASFPLNGVIAGWTEGLQLMVEGETRRLWIPEELAYQGRPGRPAGMLVFDVELISIGRR